MQRSVKGEECWESKDQTELLCQEAVQQEAFITAMDRVCRGVKTSIILNLISKQPFRYSMSQKHN